MKTLKPNDVVIYQDEPYLVDEYTDKCHLTHYFDENYKIAVPIEDVRIAPKKIWKLCDRCLEIGDDMYHDYDAVYKLIKQMKL